MAIDYYATLGVNRKVSNKEIRQAYRRLARQYHPDLNPGSKSAEETFKSINQAYEVLSDPEKRNQYDRWGENWQHDNKFAHNPRGRAGWNVSTSTGRSPFQWADMDFGNLFEELTGRSRGSHSRSGRTQQSTRPMEISCKLTLEEAFQGTTRIVAIDGHSSEQPRRLEIKIPPGVDTGSKVHISPRGGPNLNMLVQVQPHPRFRRQGTDLHVDVKVPLEDAVLGTEINVETLRSKIALKLPPETQNGRRFRLKNHGMPKRGDAKSLGSLYATVHIVLPQNLSPEERELFEKLRSMRAKNKSDKS